MIIDRVPKDTEKYFLEVAESGFMGERGLLLKYLCDIHMGFFPTGHEEIEMKLDSMFVEIKKLNDRVSKLEKPTRKMLSGRMI